MNIFPRKPKENKGGFYFGEYNESPLAPFSISLACFDQNYSGEKKHYHTRNQKVYLTLEGEGVLNVDGKEFAMKPEEMIHIEPNEVHFISRVVKQPFKFVVICSSKIDDKVIVN